MKSSKMSSGQILYVLFMVTILSVIIAAGATAQIAYGVDYALEIVNTTFILVVSGFVAIFGGVVLAVQLCRTLAARQIDERENSDDKKKEE